MSPFEAAFRSLTEGFGQNCIIFAVTLIAAIPLGLVIAFGSMSKFRPFAFWGRSKNVILKAISKFAPIRWLSRTFVWIIRGTPLMLQIFVVLYAPGLLWQMPMRDRMLAVLIAFAINYAAYFSEIYRGGIESISKGQYEAGQVLGMTRRETFFKVVLLQVVKRIIPPMSNEIITLVKDTSLARVVTYYELIYFAQRYIKNAGLLWPLFYTAVYYLVFTALLTFLFGKLEKKLNYFN